MTEPIKIPFEGVDKVSAVANKIQKELDETANKTKSINTANSSARFSFTEVSSAISLVTQGLEIAKKVYNATAGETLAYANQVRQLSMISGESAESTSRFIQVLDDYKIGAEDALTATRTLTKQGLTPNIDTLAKLSDKYLSLNSAEEKNAFILKNLGKSGLQWVEVLNKGSEAIRKQGDAISDSLILSQKQVDAARANEIAVDNWNDSVQALKISIGNQLLPVMTDFINGLNEGQRAAEIMREQGLNPANKASQEYRDALKQAHEEQVAATEAMLQNKEAVDQNTTSLEEQEAALKAVSDANANFISVLNNVDSARDSFIEGMAEVDAALASGDLSVDEHAAKVNELTATYQEAKNKIILSIVEMKLATDGWTNAELNAYLQVGQQLGVFTQGTVTETKRVIAAADEMIGSMGQLGDIAHHTGERAEDATEGLGNLGDSASEMGETIRKDATPAVAGLRSNIRGLPPNGASWEYNFQINVSGRVPRFASPFANTTTTSAALEDIREDSGGGRDSGGPGVPGKAYMIGKGAQPEMFVPNQPGQFYPNADKLFDTSGIIAAIQAIPRIDEKRLARAIVQAQDQRGY